MENEDPKIKPDEEKVQPTCPQYTQFFVEKEDNLVRECRQVPVSNYGFTEQALGNVRPPYTIAYHPINVDPTQNNGQARPGMIEVPSPPSQKCLTCKSEYKRRLLIFLFVLIIAFAVTNAFYHRRHPHGHRHPSRTDN